MSALPHHTYAAAIAGAVAADDWDTWTDGGTTMTALYQWTNTVWPRHNPAIYRHGVALRWDSDAGWQWGRYLDSHHTELAHLTPLPVDQYAAPAAVAAAMQVILTDPDQPAPAGSGRWIHADTLAANLTAKKGLQ
ncbi:hypothetical protein [Streptomyces qinglanensis]|uniref:hypothetical protein n=1 Tax=Streptomyces qinglanensis TaxID=943816 RepID=UPI0037AA2101